MPYTNIAKPTGANYTNPNVSGKQTYDQSDITYDDSGTFYDSINYLAYTNLATPSVAWNLNRAMFNATYDISAQVGSPEYILFKSDGAKMYIGGNTYDIFEYSLSTAWDVSTRAYVQLLDMSSFITSYAEAGFFSEDGLKLFVVDDTLPLAILNQLQLTTAWDISTASFLSSSPFVHDDGTGPSVTGMFFSPDGMKVFVTTRDDKIEQYELITAWNVASMKFRSSLNIATVSTTSDGLYFKPDGTKMYFCQYNGPSTVFEFTLSTPWLLGTALSTNSLQISASDIESYSSFFRVDGLKLYVTANPSLNVGNVRDYNFTEQYTNITKPT